MLTIEKTLFPEILLIHPKHSADERGFFMELYRTDSYGELGVRDIFVQDNQSHSVAGVLRGLHFQWDEPLSKLIRVGNGRVFAVAVDIRRNSPTLGQWIGHELSAENRVQMYVPFGFATGFAVLSAAADVLYKYSALYNPKGESSIRWNDPTIGITWPVSDPILSPRDAGASTLHEWLARPEAKYITL